MIIAVIAALAVVKDLVDLFGKPADLQLPNHDVQVWCVVGTISKPADYKY